MPCRVLLGYRSICLILISAANLPLLSLGCLQFLRQGHDRNKAVSMFQKHPFLERLQKYVVCYGAHFGLLLRTFSCKFVFVLLNICFWLISATTIFLSRGCSHCLKCWWLGAPGRFSSTPSELNPCLCVFLHYLVQYLEGRVTLVLSF